MVRDERTRHLDLEIARLNNELRLKDLELEGLRWRLSRTDPVPDSVYRRRAIELYTAVATGLAALRHGTCEEAVSILDAALRNKAPEEEERNTHPARGIHAKGLQPRTYPRPGNVRKRISKNTRARVYERDENRCRLCGAINSEGNPLTVDHIVALTLGGTNAEENLQILCAHCHKRKDKPVMEARATYSSR